MSGELVFFQLLCWLEEWKCYSAVRYLSLADNHTVSITHSFERLRSLKDASIGLRVNGSST